MILAQKSSISRHEVVLTMPLCYSQCSLDINNILAAMCRLASSLTLDLS